MFAFNRYANATLGLPCILEQTMYNGYNRDQSIFNLTIFRDNYVTSRPQLYCSSSTSVCEKMKDYHELCTNDRECLSVRINPHLTPKKD